MSCHRGPLSPFCFDTHLIDISARLTTKKTGQAIFLEASCRHFHADRNLYESTRSAPEIHDPRVTNITNTTILGEET